MKSSRILSAVLGLALIATFAWKRPLDAGVIVDPDFDSPFLATPSTPGRVRLLPDGKFVVFFGVESLTDQPTGPITRYLPDGVLDSSFRFTSDYDFAGSLSPGPDGTLIVAVSHATYGSLDGTERVLLIKADGSIDPSFHPGAIASGAANPANNTNSGNVREIAIQPDGKILLAGFFRDFAGGPRQGIVRLLPNGTVDPAFAGVTLGFPGAGAGLWATPVIQTDGKILIGGDFDRINNVLCPGVARLNADGTLDGTFQPSFLFSRNDSIPIRGIVIQAGGKIVLGGKFNAGGNVVPLVRLHSDGSFDPTYLLATGFFSNPSNGIKDIEAQADGKIVAATTSLYRFNPDGSLDSTFRQPALLINRTPGGEAFTVDVQNDGRILTGGRFTDVDDATGPPNGSRFGVARFNANGTLDGLTTAHKTGFKTAPESFVRLPDDTTLFAPKLGDSTAAVSGASPAIPHNFGRLLPDGSLDPNFDPFANADPNGLLTPAFVVKEFWRLADGRFLFAGTKGWPGSFSVARLSQNFTLDPTFTPDVSLFSRADVSPSPDGRLLLASRDPQTLVNGNLLQAIEVNGLIDDSFHPSPQILADTVQRNSSNKIAAVALGENEVLARLDDGGILLSYFAANSTWRLARLTPDGVLDASFPSTSLPVTSGVSQVNVVDPQNAGAGAQAVIGLSANKRVFKDALVVGAGKVIVVGAFRAFRNAAARGIVRLNADGSVDAAFQTGGGAQWTQTSETATEFPAIDNIELQADGKLLITGSFEAFDGVAAPGIVSLNADGSVDSTFVPPAIRRKFDTRDARLSRQADGSFLLSGPYSLPNQTLAPWFIHILAPPVITSPPIAGSTVGQRLVYLLEAAGATSKGATNLPPGLAFYPTLGTIIGTPSAAGTFQVMLSATNASGTTNGTLTITVQPAPPSGPVITSSTSTTARPGRPFSFRVTISGGNPSTLLSANGLPPGLTFNAVTGLILGIPTAEGSSAVSLVATDGNLTASSILQLTFTADPALPVIISPNTASVAPGEFFSYTINAPTTAPPSDVTIYALFGTLPEGLTFDSKTGTISGIFMGNPQRDGQSPDRNNLSGGIFTNVDIIAENSRGATAICLHFTESPQGVLNVSTRIAVGTGNNVPIAGFIIKGNASKQVFIRAIAPSLAAYGVPGTLQDPILDLYDGDKPLGTNDNWRDFQEDEIAKTGPLGDNRESAIIAYLSEEKTYTAVVRGKNDSSGVALVEVYDLGTYDASDTAFAELAQISTRGNVQTGDNCMIGGFIISGIPTRVLLRAIGPSLSNFGIANSLQDPTLELRDSSGSLINANDDWETTQKQQIIDTKLPPPQDSRESAIVAILNPGAYTAIVRGKANTTGVALVEVYRLP